MIGLGVDIGRFTVDPATNYMAVSVNLGLPIVGALIHKSPRAWGLH